MHTINDNPRHSRVSRIQFLYRFHRNMEDIFASHSEQIVLGRRSLKKKDVDSFILEIINFFLFTSGTYKLSRKIRL